MLNIIWLAMMLIALCFGILNHTLADMVIAVTDYAKLAFTIALGLTGIMAFWLGLMKIAEASGLVEALSRKMFPLLRRLFPDIPADDPALGAMMMNITANMLGLANAATPLGIKAMEYLRDINPHKGIASDSMCMFLAINTSSVQLIPVTAIAFLAANGATEPTSVILSSLIATTFSTLAALVAVKVFSKMKRYRIAEQESCA